MAEASVPTRPRLTKGRAPARPRCAAAGSRAARAVGPSHGAILWRRGRAYQPRIDGRL